MRCRDTAMILARPRGRIVRLGVGGRSPPWSYAHEMRVLIVDDQAAFRDASRELLEKRGHVVAEAVDESEALRATARFDPDAVLVDVRLGGESGFDVARALTRAWP